MHLLKFVSYTGSGHVDAVFTDGGRAQREYLRAVQTRGAAIAEWTADSSLMVAFELTDDYGVLFSLNLFNCVVVLINTEASAKVQRDLLDANEAAQAKYGKSTLGFGSPTPGVPVV